MHSVHKPAIVSSGETLLTIPDAAVRTNRSVTVLRHWARLGRIPAVKLGRDWFIRETDLALIEAMPRRNRRKNE